MKRHRVRSWCARPGRRTTGADRFDGQRRRLVEQPGNESRSGILGLYDGVRLTQRDSNYTFLGPDRIFVYRGPLTRMCESPEELVDEVRITVVQMARFGSEGRPGPARPRLRLSPSHPPMCTRRWWRSSRSPSIFVLRVLLSPIQLNPSGGAGSKSFRRRFHVPVFAGGGAGAERAHVSPLIPPPVTAEAAGSSPVRACSRTISWTPLPQRALRYVALCVGGAPPGTFRS